MRGNPFLYFRGRLLVLGDFRLAKVFTFVLLLNCGVAVAFISNKETKTSATVVDLNKETTWPGLLFDFEEETIRDVRALDLGSTFVSFAFTFLLGTELGQEEFCKLQIVFFAWLFPINGGLTSYC